jgi:hypothetical protein
MAEDFLPGTGGLELSHSSISEIKIKLDIYHLRNRNVGILKEWRDRHIKIKI